MLAQIADLRLFTRMYERPYDLCMRPNVRFPEKLGQEE